ncbi:hypothetical protein N9M83_04365 [Candidatus Poseidonia alphae]|nr:hypothetical protein [Candidatus Poseidonia alphae]
MNKFLTMLFAIMLVLSGCLGGEDVSGNEEPQPVLLDTDGDGIPDVEDEDDDGDSWSDIDELNCDSDSLLASSVPADANGDGICDIRDLDDDGDSFADAVENQCGSDPLDATSVPADLDADGTCDALDDDIDGDGVANADDFAPEDPEKSEGVSGCTDATAFNYDEAAEVDDASCFTLADAEEAVEAAMAGIASMEATELSDDMIIQTTLTMDEANGKSRLSIAMLGDDLEPIYQATYVDDGTGFVGVELYLTPDEGGLSPITEQYKVNGAYYTLDMDDDSGWSHCEYDGTDWYCTDIFMMGEMVYDSDSETDTYHLYTCADGDTVLLSQVNDGTEDCADASDEPNVQSDGSMYMCDDGSTIDFYLANDGEADCADGSDEDNFITQYTCDNGNTIPSYWVNDEYDDCGDGSDEPVYDMSAYETSVYTCEDGSEVPLSTVNDGTDDCADGTDETPSGEIQELFEFPCSGDINDDDDEFVSIGLVNDGKEDCSNGGDEVTYDTNGDENSTFTCYDYWNDEQLNTIALSSVNDGQVDCLFHDDEVVDAADNWFGLEFDEEDEEEEGITFTGECQVDGEDSAWPWVFINDGVEDCDGATDEDDGTGTMTYTCEDGTVISFALLNDGSDDCSEGEDEPDYVIDSDYTCENGEIVEFHWINDGEEDCEDGTDEPTYDLEELTDFECDDGTLIPFSHVNDGSDDCTNAEDEPDITMMEYTTFECGSGDEIPLSSVNDGTDDCPGGDDEPSYDPITQNEVSSYTCLYSGETIALSLVNDGGYDCEDSSDEPDYYEEDTNEMECADGSGTVQISYANDGDDDCDDGSDEAQYEMPEDESVFYCADGSEITVSQFNDGAVDCTDGSDEPATFLCDDGSDEILFGYINDGGDDCMDGSDESVVEDLNVADCHGSDDGSTLTVSQFHDGINDCAPDTWMQDSPEQSWDEMDFELASECEWKGDGIGWMCTDVFFPTDATYEMWMHTDENGLEMIGLNATLSDGMVMTAMFDAATHAFLMMEEIGYDEDGDMDEHVVITSSTYDPTLIDALTVDTTLDTHAPPFAVVFNGEPHAVDDGKVFVCEDGEEVLFAYANDGEEDCADGSDEPTYEEEVYTCSDDGSEIPMSYVNDGEDDCADGSDEPSYDGDGFETSIFVCIHSGVDGDEIPLSYVNDGWTDCGDGTDEEEGYSWEISGFECDDGDEINLSEVNNGQQECMDGSDEATVGEGHGYGDYGFISTGIAEWTIGADDDTLEVVFAMCDTFDDAESMFADADYLLSSDCGDELARYTMDEIDNGDITGLMLMYDDNGIPMLLVDEDFELDDWNTVRLSTPNGEFADENPQVQLPAPGIGFAILAMLGAAMMAGRRNE